MFRKLRYSVLLGVPLAAFLAAPFATQTAEAGHWKHQHGHWYYFDDGDWYVHTGGRWHIWADGGWRPYGAYAGDHGHRSYRDYRYDDDDRGRRYRGRYDRGRRHREHHRREHHRREHHDRGDRDVRGRSEFDFGAEHDRGRRGRGHRDRGDHGVRGRGGAGLGIDID